MNEKLCRWSLMFAVTADCGEHEALTLRYNGLCQHLLHNHSPWWVIGWDTSCLCQPRSLQTRIYVRAAAVCLQSLPHLKGGVVCQYRRLVKTLLKGVTP